MNYDNVFLLIAIPTLDYNHYMFTESLINLTQWLNTKKISYRVVFNGGTLVYMSRDRLVDMAVREGKNYTHVLWLDSDMVFEPDIFEKLYATGKDFVVPLFRGRHGKQSLCIFKSLNPSVRFESEEVKAYRGSLFEVAGSGFGCVLTSTKLLKKVVEEYGSSFSPIKNFGEDTSFCKRVGDLGEKMWCLPTVGIGHISQTIVWPIKEDTNI